MTNVPVRILGIDPGSRITGFGVIEADGVRLRYRDSGCIRTADGEFCDRLEEIFRQVGALVQGHGPDEVCLERVFVHRNADSALKLGHARAAALCAVFGGRKRPLVREYSPRQVKQSVAGYGGADKEQVQTMVSRLLALSGRVQADAADALAVALCHAHHRRTGMLLAHASAAAPRGGR